MERWKLGYCDACKTEDVELALRGYQHQGAEKDLCAYCAGTLLGNIILWQRSGAKFAMGVIQALHLLEKRQARKETTDGKR